MTVSKTLLPRNGHTLVVGIVARISGCAGQKEVSLDDQIDHGMGTVTDLYHGPVDYRVIATKGKGEQLNRPELAELETMLRRRELDLLVCEDIGRMVRGTEAAWLCGIAVDHGTRVIAPNDCIDTDDSSWEEDVIAACRDHVGHNAHTSKRLKQKLMNRFVKFGGAPALPIFGYIKPPGAKTYNDWQKDPSAIPVYEAWFKKLFENPNCSALADWLNEKGVPTGAYCRLKRWNMHMVRRITANPLLKGFASRGRKRTEKHHESGRRILRKNPSGPQWYECEHLRFVSVELWDAVNAKIDHQNQHFKRKRVSGDDPRLHVSRKRTRFPGQHAVCYYCGRQYVWGGNGLTNSLMCSGSREGRCWNSIGFDGRLATESVCAALMREFDQLEGFNAQFRDIVNCARQNGDKDLHGRREKLRQGEEALARSKDNILAAIAQFGAKPMFEAKLAEIEKNERNLALERCDIAQMTTRIPEMPESISDLRQMFAEHFNKLAADSWEFGDLLRKLLPDYSVFLVRLCDGGHLLPRARVTLALDAIVPELQYLPEIGRILRKQLTFDVFEPVQREQIREEAVRLAAQGMQQRDIAKHIAGKPTQTAVYRALILHRKMKDLGLSSPYVNVLEPPADYSKLRRYLRPTYKFEPTGRYERPPL